MELILPQYLVNETFNKDCLKKTREFLDISEKMNGPEHYHVRAFVAISLLYWHLEEGPKNRNPIPEFVKSFDKANNILRTFYENSICSKSFFRGIHDDMETGTGQVVDSNFEEKISNLFGDVWVDFSDEVYFQEALDYTVERFRRNNVDAAEYFRNKTILDAGCGSGKYSAALATLGAKKVIGIDIGEKGLSFAEKQRQKHPRGDVIEYRYCSLLDIQLDDSSVDMVWSNGVIHHTKDYEKCLSEFARVIKPGGDLYLYVEGPEGLFELLCDTLIEAHKSLPRSVVQKMLGDFDTNSGRVYWIMDCLFAPYERKSRDEVENLLKKHGFENLFPMLRGLDIDNNEMVHVGVPYSEIKQGVGMLKYLATLKK